MHPHVSSSSHSLHSFRLAELDVIPWLSKAFMTASASSESETFLKSIKQHNGIDDGSSKRCLVFEHIPPQSFQSSELLRASFGVSKRNVTVFTAERDETESCAEHSCSFCGFGHPVFWYLPPYDRASRTVNKYTLNMLMCLIAFGTKTISRWYKARAV
ncbi:hypothetical protein RB195_005227 [Necator americanus]|uniref:Uncharacterized protein n=1 Tax=Necator americanus TaxID=51031 RepID=A0ABR1BQ14_NECAM